LQRSCCLHNPRKNLLLVCLLLLHLLPCLLHTCVSYTHPPIWCRQQLTELRVYCLCKSVQLLLQATTDKAKSLLSTKAYSYFCRRTLTK
jgi:hypothetical protein